MWIVFLKKLLFHVSVGFQLSSVLIAIQNLFIICSYILDESIYKKISIVIREMNIS